VIRRLLRWMAFITLLASALSFGAPWNWLADLLVNFRVQYMAIGLILAVILALWRDWRAAAAAALAGLLSLPAAWGHAVPAAQPRVVASDAPWRAVSANLLFLNDRRSEVLQWARGTRADVLVFIEAAPEWSPALQALAEDYPHRLPGASVGSHGIEVLSRWPLAPATMLQAADGSRYGLATRVTRPAGEVDLIAVHLTWPVTPAHAARRALQLQHLAIAARQRPQALAVLGDFNTTPFSPVFQDLLRASGLRSAAAGRGWQPTWPAFLPPAGIQIDHVLLGGSLEVQTFHRDTIPGSDHRAVIVELRP
jgi:endonuclease/exonuclease/phosphatase (EEP) superfamily protein YafD